MAVGCYATACARVCASRLLALPIKTLRMPYVTLQQYFGIFFHLVLSCFNTNRH